MKDQVELRPEQIPSIVRPKRRTHLQMAMQRLSNPTPTIKVSRIDPLYGTVLDINEKLNLIFL